MLNDMFAMLKASGSYNRQRKEWQCLHFGACQASKPIPG